jgi:hypothetical protein
VFELVCPQCDRTYRDDTISCERCQVPLVVRFTGSAGTGSDATADATRDGAPIDDRVVELTRLPTLQAEIVATRLRAEGIPSAVFAEGFAAWMFNEFTSGRRVMVLERDLDRAQQILDDLFSDGDAGSAPVDDADLAAQAEAADGFTDPETGAVV